MPKLRKDVVAVVHHIHVRTPHQHIAELFVMDLPSEATTNEVKQKLEASGRRFGEFGIAWANYYLVRLHEAEPEIRGAWRRNEFEAEEGNQPEIECVTWSELSEETDETEVLFLRVPSRLKEALAQKATAEKVSVNEYCARVLASAAQ